MQKKKKKVISKGWKEAMIVRLNSSPKEKKR